MIHLDPKQSLLPALDKLLDGIAEFSAVVDRRIDSGEWQPSHLSDVQHTRVELLLLSQALRRLKKDTW